MGNLMQFSANQPSRDSGRVTRAHLAYAILRRIGLSRAESTDIVDAVLTEIIDVLASGENLKLQSFGSFHVLSKKERPGCNPRTGIPATVSARRVVTFKPSDILCARINEHS